MRFAIAIRRRIPWAHLPFGFLVMLLQRSPALRIAALCEERLAISPIGSLLRSTVALAGSLGAIDALAGATTVTASPASPLNATVGVPVAGVVFGVTGIQGPPSSWSIDSIPPGLNFQGHTIPGTYNVVSQYGTAVLSGNPTAPGNFTLSLVAFEYNNGTGLATQPFSYTVTVTGAGSPPSITTQPASQAVNAGPNVTLSVTVTGATNYQWQFNGAAIAGATNTTLSLPNIGTTQRGSYTVVVSNGYGPVTSNPATVAVSVNAYLANISARAFVGTGSQVLVAGFVVSGSGSKQLLIRGVGPTLAQYSVAGPLANPQLSLYDSSSAVIATDIGWSNASTKGPSTVPATISAATSALFNQLYAFPLPAGSADCAMSAGLPVSQYTAQVSGVGGTTGVALAELYDADTGSPPSHLVNISARAYVGTGSQVLVAGFVISGSTPETVLIRGVGPTEAQYGVTGSLAAPQLALYDTSGLVIASNTGWGNGPLAGPSPVPAGLQPATSAVFSSVYAFTLPTGSADCAMVVTLPPGSYTAQVSGGGGTTGVSLVEVYNLP